MTNCCDFMVGKFTGKIDWVQHDEFGTIWHDFIDFKAPYCRVNSELKEYTF